MSNIDIKNLRVEYLVNPTAIDDPAPRFSWRLESGERNLEQSAYRIVVSEAKSEVEAEKGTAWDSGKIKSAVSNPIVYAGQSLKSFTKYFWRVCVWTNKSDATIWSETAEWGMGILKQDEWKACWIHYPVDPVRDPRYFRHEFKIDKPVKRAILYSTARGVYEPHLNGGKVGDSYFTPGWTNYNKRQHYNSYDVTSSIKQGENALGAILSEGWYKGHVGFGNRMGHYGSRTLLMMDLRIEYEDGSVENVVTGEKWKTTIGPIQEAGFLMGEKYDSRYEFAGWDDTGYDESAWQDAPFARRGKPYWDNSLGRMVDPLVDPVKFETYPCEPIRETQEIEPVDCWQPIEGSYIYDMGQNFAGFARIKVKGKAGEIVRLRFAEILTPQKKMYVENLRSAVSIDEFTLSGGEQEWQPRFTFHGFRYVEITGLTKEQILSVKGIVVGSDTKPVGSFKCSNEMINQLYSNIVWTQRSNFIEIPTDCPQRDERLGWTGDAQVFIKSAMYNMDVAAFFTKWLKDLEDTQDEAGAVMNVAPDPKLTGRADAAWGDAVTVCPWWLYNYYGDKRFLEKYFGMMEKWIAYLESTSKDYIRSETHCFGDWLSINAETPKEVIQTAFFAYSAMLTMKAAEILGKNKEAEKYSNLFDKIKVAFINKYVSDNGDVTGSTQTAYVLALHFGLLPENLRGKTAALLRKAVEERDCHLSTGFVGTPYLLPTLTANGMHDLAMKLLLNETYPSWGYSIRNGATTIWERWNGWTEKDGCGDANMNSYSHYAYGSVCEWMFSTLAGIRLVSAGFDQIIIKPTPGEGMDWVEAEYESIHGKIRSAWKKAGEGFELAVKIPDNTRAKIVVPAEMKGAVSIDGGKTDIAVNEDNGCRFVEVGSGEYKFSIAN
ncbi:MAG: family 78 glycoside hydrolase catalytic domain [Planctomycetes bacterium]|nr:family 78 glycoside hydrolase catalytic domain [Planctomycetota bacterium]